MTAMVACLTDPPPDLVVTSTPPTIIHVAVQPPEGLITTLTASSTFTVPISTGDPTQCFYSVYDEYTTYRSCVPCPTSTFDGRTVEVDFGVGSAFDTSICHTLRFTVGSSFAVPDQFCHSGSDVATWRYVPSSCTRYDAGSLDDGAFPEASTDGLPIVPDAGASP